MLPGHTYHKLQHQSRTKAPRTLHYHVQLCQVDVSNFNTTIISRTMIEWYVVRHESNFGHQRYISSNEIELIYAQDMLTILDLMLKIIGETYMTT